MSFLDVENRRAIIDRRAIADRLSGLRAGKRLNSDAATILRDALASGRTEIARRLTIEPGHGRRRRAGDRLPPRPARPTRL